MTVGILVVAMNLVAGVWGLLLRRRGGVPSRTYAQVLALSHTVILAQALFGLYLLTGGHRASQQLHYVYGLLPAGAIVFAYSARSEDQRRNLLVFAIVALVAAALAVRAYTTGPA
jgi:hypothetical protein